ncbi:hypothetical protein [Nostoc sp.]|uniref:hypothetical protein n=1 Tax=Nostoc sp. TaxID=1180 RepID=UPI003593F790
MKRLLKFFMTISALSSLIVARLILSDGQASAETKKGAGVATGVTSGGQVNDDATFGGNVTGRLKLGNTPFSVRGNVLLTKFCARRSGRTDFALWSDQTSAIIPEVSLDVPIANRTNAYLTGGYSFVKKDGLPTPIGNRDAVVLDVGVESEVANKSLVYTNAKIGFGAYQNSDASAVNINGGIAYRFK